MKDLFFLLVFFFSMFLVVETIVYGARLLGAPYTWFPAHWYPVCPECRQRTLKRCMEAGQEVLTLHAQEFYQCQVCGARWMRDCSGSTPWEDASARKWDRRFLPETASPSVVSSDVWPPPPTISGRER